MDDEIKRGVKVTGDQEDKEQQEKSLFDPPESLNEVAQKEWVRLVHELHAAKLMADTYRTALEVYCVTYSNWVKYVKQLETEDHVIMTQHNNLIQNPLVGMANKAAILMHKYLTELGLTPGSRGKQATIKPKQSSLWGDD